MTGAMWGQAGPGAVFHRIPACRFEAQVAACGATVRPSHVYHCEAAAGPDAVPAIGKACEACVAAAAGGAR